MIKGKPSFQEIYERFHPGILGFLSKLLGGDEGEEVAQEVFLKVDRGLGNFRGESSVGTWVYGIARNAAIDRLRSRPAWHESLRELRTNGSDEDTEDAISLVPDEQASIEQYLIVKEMNACIRRRVDTLPESYRRVLVLSDMVGMTNGDIASALGVGEGAVKIRLHRARARLRKDLNTHCTLYRDERDELGCEPKPALGRS